MFRNRGGNGVPLGQFSRGDQAVYARRAEFIGFIHGLVSENFCFIGRLPGSDGHHIKPIPADFKFGARGRATPSKG